MRVGDSRVQALAGALCGTVCAVTGITDRSLRAVMTELLGAPRTMTRAGYGLARLRRDGLITRRPRVNTYRLTPGGLKFAVFCTKVHDRVLAPCPRRGDPGLSAATRCPDRYPAPHRQRARVCSSAGVTAPEGR